MKKSLPLLLIVVLFVAGCAAGPNTVVSTPAADGDVAGFWHGLWHGLIAPITFVVSLLSENVNIYEVHNNGNWYNLGFLMGASVYLYGR